MKKIITLSLAVFLAVNTYTQTSTAKSGKTYKPMMNDMSINFYTVCAEADKYFETHDPKVKGSGWKGYQRWRSANEYKYFPSGERSNIDPFFVENAYKSFIKNNPQAKNIATTNPLPGTAPSPYNNGWLELGPFRIDSISGHYSAGLGRIEDHFVDPANTNKMYVGSRSGGFWRTVDGGTNWQNTTDYLVASGVNTITASPSNSDSVLINVRNSRNGNSHGLYRSVDGGLTWTQSNFNPATTGFGGLGTNFKIYEIRYHPRVANLVFIGTSKGIFRSDDNLATWTRLINSGDIEEIQFHPTNDSIIYIYNSYYWGADKNVVLRSVDQGLSYTQSNIVHGNNNNTSVHLSVSNDCSDCLYWGSGKGVWKSLDNGMNFDSINNPNEGCGGFVVNDLDTNFMIYGYVDIDRTTDGGKTWVDATRWSLGNTNGAGSGHQNSFNTSTNYVHADLHPAKSVNGIFYVGTDGLFCKSTDNGQSWTTLSQGIATRENYKLGVSQSNHFRSISGSQDNGTSIKHQDNWIEFYGADGMEGLIHPLNDDWMIGSLQSGGRRRTKDGGITQGGVSPSGQSGSGKAAWEAPISYDPNNQMTVYNFSKFVYKSTDFGSTWDSIGKPTTFTGTIGQAAIAENNSDIILISAGSRIEKSIDGGATFVDIKGTLPGSGIQDIAFDPNDDNTIIVVYASYANNNQKVYKTTDGGTSWINITHNLGNMPIHSVVIDHTNASNIYLGAEIGVYTMPINSTNWVLYNPNLPNCTVEELEIVYGSNTLKGATWGRGMWEYTLVGRNNFPSIITTKITDQPTENLPKENVDQFVTSTISYANTPTSVYIEWSANNPTFGNVISMTNTVDSTWVSNTAIPNQVFGTKVYFKVFAVGTNNDTTETYKFMYTVKENIYCTSSGTINYQGNVTLVDFGGINNATGKTQAYSDYTATDSTTVIAGNSYDITVNLNTDNGQNYRYYSTIWVDWNNDTDFDDAGEKYEIGYSQGVTNGPTTFSPFSILVPVNANIGKTRMRVVCKYNSHQTNPCANGYDGEVEDYTLIIVPPPSLSFTINETVICENEKIHFNYTGDAMDSYLWTYTNGTNNFTSTNENDSLTILNAGTYNLNLRGILGTDTFTLDSIAVFVVNSTSSHTENLTTCDQANVGTIIDTLVNSVGCDSILTTITTLLPSSFDTINITTCYQINAGTTIDTLVNSLGCDSIITTMTSFLPTTYETVNTTSCQLSETGMVIDTLVSTGGCDSILTTVTTYAPNNPIIVNETSCFQGDAGTVMDTIFAAGVCDSLVTTITIFTPSTNETVNTTSCMQSEVGTTIDTLVNAGGCDSILTTFITYAPNNPIIINATSCFQGDAGTVTDTVYTIGMCDSIIMTITTFVPTTYETINLTSCVESEIGITIDTLINAGGCDSILTTITSLGSITASITVSSNILTAFPSGMDYQWQICEPNMEPIVGANNETFIATSNGTYAVKITNGACSAISSCEQITGIGIIENSFETEIKLFPNPTNGLLTIEMEGSYKTIDLEVKNDIGQVIISKTETNTTFNINLLDYSAGIYFLHISAEGKNAVFKVLKE